MKQRPEFPDEGTVVRIKDTSMDEVARELREQSPEQRYRVLRYSGQGYAVCQAVEDTGSQSWWLHPEALEVAP